MVTEYPTADDMRLTITLRVRQFHRATGISISEIGKKALGDTAAIPRLMRDGSDFKVSTYETLMKWLTDNWPGRRSKREASEAPSAT